jgi:hypothetical protein
MIGAVLSAFVASSQWVLTDSIEPMTLEAGSALIYAATQSWRRTA